MALVSNIHTVFILQEGCEDETEASQIFKDAFKVAAKLTDNIKWVCERDSEEVDLIKTVFLVFDEFKGAFYEKALKSPCARIIGPWCLIQCNAHVKPIPNVTWPILNMTLDGCVVVCSNLSKVIKSDIKHKVLLMGGLFTTELVQNNTHLITPSVRSEKYIQAAKSGIQIFTPNWIEAIWEASQSRDVDIEAAEFQKLKCLPFNKLTICTTGFTDAVDKKEIESLVTSNGGIYSTQLNLKLTQILICNGTTSAKFNAARKHKIDCVTIQWIYDSVESGFAQPDMKKYQVKKVTSTPTKNDQFDPNFSTISAIAAPYSGLSVLEDTANATITTPKRPSAFKIDELESLDIKRVKLAGPFLDGCTIYLTGFPSNQREKMIRVINFSGAHRYDVLSDRITHVVVGDPTFHELKLIKSKNLQCAIVSFQWLLESMNQQMPVSEESYLIDGSSASPGVLDNNTGSPLSKKGLSLLRADTSIRENKQLMGPPTAPPINEESQVEEVDLMKQYLHPGNSGQEDTLAQLLAANQYDKTAQKSARQFTINKDNKTHTKSSYNESTTDSLSISMDTTQFPFENLKFLVIDFNDKENDIISERIGELGGSLVSKNFKGIKDYAVLPKFSSKLNQKATHVVSDLFISECYEHKSLLEIKYYHEPILIVNEKVLERCVISLSNYCGFERLFLKELIIELGATFQDSLSRRPAADNSIITSTHLVCSDSEGKKYAAAVKWLLPVINKNWLLKSTQGVFVNETKFIVGNEEYKEKLEASSKKSAVICKENINLSQTKFNMSQNANMLNISINKQTPTKRKSNNESNYETPTRNELRDDAFATPDNKNGNNSGACSQITPVNQIMQQAIFNNVDVDFPKTPKPWDHVDTPESPLGAFIRPNPSPELRKKFQRWINGFPDFKPPQRRLSTPLSELKRRIWDKIVPDPYMIRTAKDKIAQPNFEQEEDVEGIASTSTSTENYQMETEINDERKDLTEEEKLQNAIVLARLAKLETMLASSTGDSRRNSIQLEPIPVDVYHQKESQPFSVGWDEDLPSFHTRKSEKRAVFMISGTDSEERDKLVVMLETLGASISDLANYDPACTHLICPKINRNEKSLASMAAGKWILHTSYVQASLDAGIFKDEEEYEFGNPKSKNNLKMVDKETEHRAAAAYYWRNEISRRGYAAFYDVKAIIIAAKRDPIVRVIEAGGGMIVNESPPFNANIYATHCLIEIKSISNYNDFIPLAKAGILCMQTLFVNDFLNRTPKESKDFIIPGFAKYYTSVT